MESNSEIITPDSEIPTLPLLSELSLHPYLIAATNKLGYEQATLIQSKVIPLVLAGKDLLVSAETGSGKTAAFLLPCLDKLLNSKTAKLGIQILILTPTRELAQQTKGECQKLTEFTELETGLIIGSEDFKKQQNLLRRQPDILIATPGRLLEHLNQDEAKFDFLKILVIDEADRMLDMGFSPDVFAIAEYCNTQRQTLLLSATVTAEVNRVSSSISRDPEAVFTHHFRTNEHSHIQQQIIPSDDKAHKQKLALWLLTHETYKKALVFTNTKLEAEALSNVLRNGGLRANALHGDMDQTGRKRIMRFYRSGSISVLVATDLAARGLDVEDIQLVINFDMARNANMYVHRIGRTGRAGEQGLAISLINANEWNLMIGIERYLHQHLERRVVKELVGSYKGPKKLKKSGKAAMVKKKIAEKKAEKVKVKVRARDTKNIGKRRVPRAKPMEVVETSVESAA